MTKDYTKPPTEEFRFLSEVSGRYSSDSTHWLTLQKAVMNDYWFDCREKDIPWTREYIDHFMHKIYFCWQEYLLSIGELDGEEE